MTGTPDDGLDPVLRQAVDSRVRRAAIAVLCGALIALIAGLFLGWSGKVVTYRTTAGTTFAIGSLNVFEWNRLLGAVLLLLIGVAGVVAGGLVFFTRSLVGTLGHVRVVFLLCGISLMGIAIWNRGQPGPTAVFAGGLIVALSGAAVSPEKPERAVPATTAAATAPAPSSNRGPRASKKLGITAVSVLVMTVLFVVIVFVGVSSRPSTEGDMGVAFMAGSVAVVGLVAAGGLGLAAILAGISSPRPPGAKRLSRPGIILGTIAVAPLVSVMAWGAVASFVSSEEVTVPSFEQSGEPPLPELTITAEPRSLDHSTGGVVRFTLTRAGGDYAGDPVRGVEVTAYTPLESVTVGFGRTDKNGVAEISFAPTTDPVRYEIQGIKDNFQFARAELILR